MILNNFLKKNLYFLLIIFLTFLSFIFLLNDVTQVGITGGVDSYKYIDWAVNLFQPNFDTPMFRPFFFLYCKLAQFIFGVNDYSIKILNLFIYSLNSLLIFFISNKIFNKNIISILPSIIYITNPSVGLFAASELTNMLGSFLLLLNFFFFINLIEKSNLRNIDIIKYSIIFGFLSAISLFTREELILLSIVNWLYIFTKNDLKTFFVKFSFYSCLSFLVVASIFLFFFATKNFIKNHIVLILNVIQREINFSIRGYFRDIPISDDYSLSKFFNNLLEYSYNIFQGTEINIIIILILFLFLFFKIFFKKFLYNIKIIELLFYNLVIYILFFIFIRHSGRLFVTFYPIFFIFIVVSLYYFFDFFKFNNKVNVFFLALFILILFNFYHNFPKKFKHEIQSTRIIFNYFKDKVDDNNKILILSSIETLLPHFILEKNLYSENYHLASNAYFGNNAIIFSQILNYNDLDSFDLFLKKNNIKYILFNPNIKQDLLLNSKVVSNLHNLFPNKIDELNNFNKINRNKINNYEYLKFYNSDMNYFILNTSEELQLINFFFIPINIFKINSDVYFFNYNN
jgi:hypothetical protein